MTETQALQGIGFELGLIAISLALIAISLAVIAWRLKDRRSP